MKAIDLLNMISKGEEVPKKIKFYDKYYIWYDNGYTGNEGYCLEPLKCDSNSFLEINTLYDLNKEVEIIEEDKKINTINWKSCGSNLKELNKNIDDLANKVNEIIDVLNEMREDK